MALSPVFLYSTIVGESSPPFYLFQDKGDMCVTISIHIFGVVVELLVYSCMLQVIQDYGFYGNNPFDIM